MSDYKPDPPDDDPHALYANSRLEDLSTEEMVDLCVKKGLIDHKEVVAALTQALYDYFYEVSENEAKYRGF